MNEISNKTLAILLIGAIVISLGGTLISLNRLTRVRMPGITGFATDEATIALQIIQLIEVQWKIDSINWGTGKVITNRSGCTLKSFPTSIGPNCTGTGFEAQEDGLILENTGNVDVNLTIKTGDSANQFIGGANPVYKWKGNNSEAGSCVASAGFVLNQFYNATINTERHVCSNFSANDGLDEMRFDVEIWIPSNAEGQKSDTMTATALLI